MPKAHFGGGILEIIKLYNDFIKDAPDKIKKEVKYYEQID